MSSLQEAKNHETQRLTFDIIVNTRRREVHEQVLTFDDVVKLAYPTLDGVNNPIYTVTFKNADQKPPDGTLVAGESVRIKNGTIFNVKRTGQS